jgi:protein import protein ZIM17
MTIEDLMKERGQLVKKGTLSEDGDLEFWEDGTTTKRAKEEDDVAAAGTEGQGKLE